MLDPTARVRRRAVLLGYRKRLVDSEEVVMGAAAAEKRARVGVFGRLPRARSREVVAVYTSRKACARETRSRDIPPGAFEVLVSTASADGV